MKEKEAVASHWQFAFWVLVSGVLLTGRCRATSGRRTLFSRGSRMGGLFEDYPVDDTYWNKGIMMPNIIQEVDHIVLMPRCSRHLLLGSSLGLKNAVGYWRTDSRLEYHKGASTIQEKTADANTVKCLRDKQRLTLTAATHSLTSVDLPKPAGAEMRVSLPCRPSFSRSIRRGRRTTLGRGGGI